MLTVIYNIIIIAYKVFTNYENINYYLPFSNYDFISNTLCASRDRIDWSFYVQKNVIFYSWHYTYSVFHTFVVFFNAEYHQVCTMWYVMAQIFSDN